MGHVREPGVHRAQPGKRRAERPGRRRAVARPRYGRIAFISAAAVVTVVATLGGLDLLPTGANKDAAAAAGSDLWPASNGEDGSGEETPGTEAKGGGKKKPAVTTDADRPRSKSPATAPESDPAEAALPVDSGSGYRAVFSESEQRVWLVDDSDEVVRTYPVSGSVYDNLDPGTYDVYSRSRYAVGIDDSGTMEYFVRFTQGDAGAAIGFHSIPVDDGAPVQTLDQLGTPLSHGCIRQDREDAIAMWEFAPIGTTVVVTP